MAGDYVMASVAKPLISASEFLQLEAAAPTKHQLYRGEIYAMAGASPAHNRIAGNIYYRLRQQLEGRPCQPNNSDVMVKANDLHTYPDVSVVCPPVEREDAPIEVLLNPQVIIEVLSPRTERYERNVKLVEYELTPSIAEIWLVQQDAPIVEHYVRQGKGMFRTVVTGLEATAELQCIDVRMTMKQIYDGVEFPENPFPRVVG
jgi:Uma2 family endonuclease